MENLILKLKMGSGERICASYCVDKNTLVKLNQDIQFYTIFVPLFTLFRYFIVTNGSSI